MDNRKVDVTSEGMDDLLAVLKLFRRKQVVGYRDEDKGRLVFYWSDSQRATKLPYPFTIEQAAGFALGWLTYANYGDQPDHDGSNGKGWRVFSEGWGHVGGEWQAFVAIEPVWAMYGK